jgi:uncharacterized protein YqgC (DUF456 family)
MLFFQSIGFGIAILFILIGLIGTILPILPGSLLIAVTIISYSFFNRWQTPSVLELTLMLTILLVAGTSNWWLPALGAKSAGGAPKRAILYGTIGGIIGLFFGLFIGTIIGYALGVLLGCYQKYRDLNRAIKASLGSVAGQGVAALVELGAGILVLILFSYFALAA